MFLFQIGLPSYELVYTVTFIYSGNKGLFVPFGAGDERKLESDSFTSSYGVYTACRTRDLCLRYMGENPALWADSTITPCPCSKAFYDEVVAYARVIRDEIENGTLPYSHRQMVAWLTEKKPKKPKVKKRREIPLTQERLI